MTKSIVSIENALTTILNKALVWTALASYFLLGNHCRTYLRVCHLIQILVSHVQLEGRNNDIQYNIYIG